MKVRSAVFRTAFGYMAILYADGVRRVLLPLPDRESVEAEVSGFGNLVSPSEHPQPIFELIRGIRDYLAGSPIVFPLDSLDFSHCYPFQEKVLREEHAIPYGEVRTYGWVAERIGAPRAARAVGTALARNPFPLVVPCHRCIRSDGSIGGFQRPGLKEELLALEGHIIEKGRLVSLGQRGR